MLIKIKDIIVDTPKTVAAKPLSHGCISHAAASIIPCPVKKTKNADMKTIIIVTTIRIFI